MNILRDRSIDIRHHNRISRFKDEYPRSTRRLATGGQRERDRIGTEFQIQRFLQKEEKEL